MLKKTESTQQPLETAFVELSKPDDDAGMQATESTTEPMEVQSDTVSNVEIEHQEATVDQEIPVEENETLIPVDVDSSSIAETVSGSSNVSRSSQSPFLPTSDVSVNEQNAERRQHSRLLHGEFVNIVDDIHNVGLNDPSEEVNDHSELNNDRFRLFQEAIERRIIGGMKQY